jgi:hypothetical protein
MTEIPASPLAGRASDGLNNPYPSLARPANGKD